jgi:hypothetical protein
MDDRRAFSNMSLFFVARYRMISTVTNVRTIICLCATFQVVHRTEDSVFESSKVTSLLCDTKTNLQSAVRRNNRWQRPPAWVHNPQKAPRKLIESYFAKVGVRSVVGVVFDVAVVVIVLLILNIVGRRLVVDFLIHNDNLGLHFPCLPDKEPCRKGDG